jgi:1-aminocyclopropane-1-carboxylate deaminase/D-cysteine desulfhydrase-like pyridoxal-dependent ACC family enzyme
LGAELWIKRDDTCARPYGGNKARKLELLLGQAQADSSRSLVTIGGLGSHQIVATAIYGRQLGFRTHAVVYPQPVTAAVHHNLRLASAAGVNWIPCASPDLLPAALERASHQAEQPCYLIPAGGSSPLGNLGYVAAALELHEQISAGQLPMPDAIFVGLGSGGTIAGLACGCSLAGTRAQVIGVRVVSQEVANTTVVRRQIAAIFGLLRRLGARAAMPSSEQQFTVVDNQFGDRYGQPTRAALQAIALAHEAEGIALDTTYTGKTMAAMMEYCIGPGKGRRALFWNTHNAQDTSWLLRSAAERPLPEEIRTWLLQDVTDL